MLLIILSKLPDLTFIDKFLIVISVLFALNLNMQSSGFGMTSIFCSIAAFSTPLPMSPCPVPTIFPSQGPPAVFELSFACDLDEFEFK